MHMTTAIGAHPAALTLAPVCTEVRARPWTGARPP